MTSDPILTLAQMRAAEQALFDGGVDPYALMVRAGEGAAEIIWRAGNMRETLVLCGPGNNGGDGYVIACALKQRGVPVRVAALADPRTESASRARAAWAGPVETLESAVPAQQIVDAIFGVGQSRPLDEAVAQRFATLVDAAQISHAIDVPSGVESDAGCLLSPVPMFDLVLAIGAWKPAHLLMPAASLTRQRALVDIGIDPPEGCARLLAPPRLSAPAPDAHKYRRGLVAVVAGAMPGASLLAAEATAHGGAGYVRIAGAQGLLTAHAIVQAEDISFDKARAVLVGPGLGHGAQAVTRLDLALGAGLPLVIDADAIALLRGRTSLPHGCILTPHGGEFDALFGPGDGGKIERTRTAAAEIDAVIVHKGPDTVIAAPDGRVIIAPPASSWLSTAGTGDVLAGLCAARLAASGDPFLAACEAVWLHGEAARRAGPAFIADDLVRQISPAIASRL
jgi:hydroxyethylthiazole kinase-like uncharacterized protein yjeF